MASAAERLAANVNFSAFGKATELKQRIWFTLGALIVYRLGTYLPIPGVDSAVLAEVFNAAGGAGVLGMFDMFAGGALGRMSIFALNIMPYISASIIVQLLTAVLPSFEQMKKDGEAGRKKLNQYTRYGTVVLAAAQAIGLASGVSSFSGPNGPAVADPGAIFYISTVVTIVGGTMFLMWLGEQVTARGVGNGISLIIFAGIVANLPQALAQVFELSRTGAMSAAFLILLLALAIGVIVFVVFVERAQRRLIVQYPKRQAGNGMVGGESSHLPLKLNTAGVIPPIFASSLLLLPATFQSLGANENLPDWLQFVLAYMAPGQPIYLLLYLSMIVFFCFFYTSIVFNPEETADNLRKNGGFIPGIRPGKNTALHLEYVLERLTVAGAAYLALVCLLPEILRSQYAVPFYFGGTSLLIVVSVTMDTVAQVQSHLIAHQYEGLIKRQKLRGRRR
jgi:preprotein translocase subunit SecY